MCQYAVFFFNDTATTEIYTLSLHDALPISIAGNPGSLDDAIAYVRDEVWPAVRDMDGCVGLSMMCDRESGRCIATSRSEEHTSELQSRQYLVCRLLLEKKMNKHP